MNTEKIKKLLSEISPWPWCKDYCYAAIRHVHRNCDIECLAHEDLDKCKSFGRYDGSFISKAPQIIDQLLRQNEILRTLLEEAIQDITDWGCYVSEYFQQKHDLAGNIERLEQALKKCDEIEIEND